MFFSSDTPRQSPHLLARQQSLCAHHKLVQVAGGYMQAYGIHQQMALFLVTRPVTLNLVNSIKCVGDSRSYLSYALSLLCAPAATHFMFIHFIILLIILYYGQVYQEYTTVYR